MAQKPVILIIEDSETQAQHLAAYLADYAEHVLIAADGPDGLQIADEYQPDVIILDVNLPSMTGYQVCDRLKRDERTRHIPVLMLTIRDSSDDALQGLESGVVDYIPKDEFAIDNLLATLQAMGLIQVEEEFV